jgi:glycosyltransferase involved in cell wall biosynthesis
MFNMTTTKRALFIAPEAPYPLHGGGALRSASLVEYLSRSYTLDAIVFHTPGSPVVFPPGYINRLLTIELPCHSKSPTARLLRNGRRLLRQTPPLVDRFSGFGARVAAFLEDYDLGVVEHFWCAPYLEQIGPRCRHTILDLHNIESAWHSGCGKVARWPHSLAHEVFYRAASDLERQWLPRYSLLLATSEQDACRIRAIAPRTSVAIYPNSIPLLDHPSQEERDLIVFSGTLEYEPNRTAVRYFAQRIWPALRLKWPNLHWKLVGRNPEAVQRYVRADPRVACTGPVDDAIAHLSAAKVAVVPLLSGSGTRLKIIEAWAAGTAVVSTSVGAEGLPARHGENILLADAPESFAAAVTLLLESPFERQRIGRAGRDQYEREFTWNAAWSALDRHFEQLGQSNGI